MVIFDLKLMYSLMAAMRVDLLMVKRKKTEVFYEEIILHFEACDATLQLVKAA